MSEQILWYNFPARLIKEQWSENYDFNEALPVGNGRIGAMVCGDPHREMLKLNEDSIWSGGMRNRINPNAYEGFQTIRQLLLEEKIKEAENIIFSTMAGVKCNMRHYMPLGNLFLYHYEALQYTNYKRSLDLEKAISRVEYTINDDNHICREVFVSAVDQVLVLHMSASKKQSLNISVEIDGRDGFYDDNRPVSDSCLLYTGGSGGTDGICFASYITAVSPDGIVKTVGGSLVIEEASELTIYLSCHTSYYTKHYLQLAKDTITSVLSKPYSVILADHIADYQALYLRHEITIDESSAPITLPTNERLLRLREQGGYDSRLLILYYNYSRYLMISGSRPHTLPLNLQGIWNDEMLPPWGSKFTININTQMNYWGAEVMNLSSCHLPLFDQIEKMRPHGRKVASEMYHCRGFVCHHNTDIWGDCAPQDLWMPATIWPMGAAWLCLHIFDHYQFTKDALFLKEHYETLKEASLFFVDYLMEDKEGHLVTGPSTSPENTYQTEAGVVGSVCIGPSMDSQILYVLFSNVIEASFILNIDNDYAKLLQSYIERLPKPEIAKYGQIKEWAIDYDEVEIGHRHVSQLFALHPANLITPSKTPDLALAARATLERRLSHGGGHTGWSRAWIINFWARLLDGEKVEENLYALLAHSTNPNLLDSHPPFQIDGNFGGSAGLIEALIQSHDGQISFLPALLPSMQSGTVKGVCARGGLTIDFTWCNGVMKTADIYAKVDTSFTIHYPINHATSYTLKKNKTLHIDF